MQPTPHTLQPSCGRSNTPLRSTMPDHAAIAQLFQDTVCDIPDATQREHMSNDILQHITTHYPELSPRQIVQKLQHYGYVAAYRFLYTTQRTDHQTAQQKNATLQGMQQTIDNIAHDLLKVDREALERYQANQAERQRGLSVLKIIRGMGCNYNCKFCLEQTDEHSMEFIKQHTTIAYDNIQELCAMLYARMAFGIKEINFSGGDPLMGDHHKLVSEVQLAKELGFPQITMITNGALLHEELIDKLVDAGLTHITISIHTQDANKYYDLVQPKNKRNPHQHIVDMIRYAASKPGLTVRLNTAILKDYTESIPELITWTRELGAQEITINEMIKANEFSIQQHIPLDDHIPGYSIAQHLGRGLTVYRSDDGKGPSVAICRFGDENFVQEQSKDLYVLPNGTLSQNMFETGHGIQYI